MVESRRAFNRDVMDSGDKLKGFEPTAQAPRFATEARSVRRTAKLSARSFEFRNLSLEPSSKLVLLPFEIVVGLEIDPEPF